MGQHQCPQCAGPGGGAGPASGEQRAGRCRAGPRRAVCTGSCPRPGGEKTQVQTSGWRAAAAAPGREQPQSDALRSTRHPPAVPHTPAHLLHQRCFSELLDNINNSSITCNTTTTTAALQLRCGDIRRQELSCAGQRCILSDGDPAVERQ